MATLPLPRKDYDKITTTADLCHAIDKALDGLDPSVQEDVLRGVAEHVNQRYDQLLMNRLPRLTEPRTE